jgi:sugar transferase (PEP-CTERM system associated)
MSRPQALRITMRSITLIACETALIVLAVLAAAYIRLGADTWDLFVLVEKGIPKALLIAAVAQACLYYCDLYDLRMLSDRHDDRHEFLRRIINALAFASILVYIIWLCFPAVAIDPTVVMIAAVFIITMVIGWRIAFEWVSLGVGPRERLLLVGTDVSAVDLAREMFERRHVLGVEIVGFIDPDPTRVGAPLLNPGIIGTIDDIPSIVRARGVDRVVVSLADARGKLPMDKLLDLRLAGVNFDHLASVYEEYTGKIAVENLRPSWLIFNEGFHKTRVLTTSKRVLDVVLAGIAAILAFPVMVLVALAVKLTSRGPAIYHQQRVGQDGQIFTIYKFRSMRQNAEAATGPVWAAKKGDTRVTPIGSWLRRARLDELPQLWNVLMGDMSLVGPRPERPEFVQNLTREIPFYGQRHIVRPGVTGWAQVRYTYGATTEDAIQKLQYDLFYIKNLSIMLDLYVLMETVKTVLLRRGA